MTDTARIMIVEDEVLVADDIADTLRGMGYEITAVEADGDDAIRRAESDRPDLVLMDIMLRGKTDGVEAASQIRSRLQIPVIFLTAYSDNEIVERAKITEPFGYLIKPFQERDLHISISIALYKSRMERKLRETEAMLLRAKKMEATAILAGGVAHDFNNLLFVILGNIGLAKENFLSGTDGSIFLKEAESAVLLARDLIRKFISFASPGEPARVPLKISMLIQNCLRKRIQDAGIRCECSFPDPMPLVEADSTQMAQALDSILENAGQAMPDGGLLKISVDSMEKEAEERLRHTDLEKGNYVRISVTDSGKGIRKQDFHKIFDPYFSTRERGTQKGMGLGLTIVHSVIRKHEGYIHIESEEGKGTSVFIYLPEYKQNSGAACVKRQGECQM